MFGFAAFAELPFATIGVTVTPAPEILLGGHFGFDEEKRNAEWAKDRKLEAQRKQTLKEALFGLPEEKREVVAPPKILEIAVQSKIQYDALLLQIESIAKQIDDEQDEQDLEMLLEYL